MTIPKAMKASRGSRGIASLINFGARWQYVVNFALYLPYPGKETPLPIKLEDDFPSASLDILEKKKSLAPECQLILLIWCENDNQ
jgi:hypothetical protein